MQNLEYSRKTRYNAAMSIYIDGNTVRKVMPEEMPERPVKSRPQVKATPKTNRKKPEQVRHNGKYAERLRARKAARKAAAIRTAAILAGVLFFASLLVVTLNGVVQSNELTNQIEKLESTYSQLKVENDSLEYDIDNTISIDTVIKSATEDLGMVRATKNQIVTYSNDSGEYIQQVAQIPKN